MTNDELNEVLRKEISNFETWKQYKILFDKNLNQETLKVTYMRAILTLAGPIGSSSKRYVSLEDDEDSQEDVVIDFSEGILDLCESNDS